MKTFNFSDGKRDITLNLPTKFNEVTADYLTSVTREIEIPNYHSLIAVIYRDKLISIVNGWNKKGDLQASAVPVFVKTGFNNNDDNDFISKINPGTSLIVSGSDISIGYHVNAHNNALSISRIASLVMSDIASASDKVISKAMTMPEPCYFVEFKIIPNTAIHGYFNPELDKNIETPFLTIK